MNHKQSAIERLLHELSWEGDPKRYRKGGHGLENALTVEVFQALDFLPRTAFLGAVLGEASGADDAVWTLIEQAEDATIALLPGDVAYESLGDSGQLKLYAQPDVMIVSPGVYCMVEAKRFGPGGFLPEQLAKELAITLQQAGARKPLLLLVLPAAPPVLVRSHGRMSVVDAIKLGSSAIRERFGIDLETVDASLIAESVAVVTWDQIACALDEAIVQFNVTDASIRASVSRIAGSASAAIRWHASKEGGAA